MNPNYNKETNHFYATFHWGSFKQQTIVSRLLITWQFCQLLPPLHHQSSNTNLWSMDLSWGKLNFYVDQFNQVNIFFFFLTLHATNSADESQIQ